LADAWGVFTAIFGFILDVLIWVIVVIGPFALMGWALSAWIRRRRAT
jgi:membrane protein required for beta-lactamase induction